MLFRGGLRELLFEFEEPEVAGVVEEADGDGVSLASMTESHSDDILRKCSNQSSPSSRRVLFRVS